MKGPAALRHAAAVIQEMMCMPKFRKAWDGMSQLEKDQFRRNLVARVRLELDREGPADRGQKL